MLLLFLYLIFIIFNGEKIEVSLKGGEENIAEFECRFADSS